MKRPRILLALGLLAGCAAPHEPRASFKTPGPRPDLVAANSICRVGPEGGPAVADRGIGGTGAPLSAAARLADRGIGGTGIVGVITGFASVCVDGLEVHYANTVPVDIDGTAAALAALRAGQVVVIEAGGSSSGIQAEKISVRNEIAGRIEAVDVGSGRLTIAEQPVAVSSATWGASRFGRGDWVKVSGLRRGDGTVVASRLDPAPAGRFTVHGPLTKDGGVTHLGSLVLPERDAADMHSGQAVTVSGIYVAGQGQVTAVAPDAIVDDPAGYFGPSIDHMVVQAFIQPGNGTIWLNGAKVSADPVFQQQASHEGLAIVSMDRGPDGRYTAASLLYTALAAQPAAASPRAAGADPVTLPSSFPPRRSARAMSSSGSNAIGALATRFAPVSPSPSAPATAPPHDPSESAAPPGTAAQTVNNPPPPVVVTPAPAPAPAPAPTPEPAQAVASPAAIPAPAPENIPMSSNARAPKTRVTSKAGAPGSASNPTISLVTGDVTTVPGTKPAAAPATVTPPTATPGMSPATGSVTVIGTSGKTSTTGMNGR